MNQTNDWTLNSEFNHCENVDKLQHQFNSLRTLLDKLLEIEGLYYKPIDDAPTDIGIELFYEQSKIAEIYCAEVYEKLTEDYVVYSKANSFKFAAFNLNDCYVHFDKYPL